MNQFEPKLLSYILYNMSIRDILNTCSSLTPTVYQNICKDENLWKELLYRDYEIFNPIINELTQSLRYSEIYKNFYSNIIYNSPDFQEFYNILKSHFDTPKFIAMNSEITTIPSIYIAETYPTHPEREANYVDWSNLHLRIANAVNNTSLHLDLRLAGIRFYNPNARIPNALLRLHRVNYIIIQCKIINGNLVLDRRP